MYHVHTWIPLPCTEVSITALSPLIGTHTTLHTHTQNTRADAYPHIPANVHTYSVCMCMHVWLCMYVCMHVRAFVHMYVRGGPDPPFHCIQCMHAILFPFPFGAWHIMPTGTARPRSPPTCLFLPGAAETHETTTAREKLQRVLLTPPLLPGKGWGPHRLRTRATAYGVWWRPVFLVPRPLNPISPHADDRHTVT